MSTIFEEIDYRETPIGAVSLRRRTDPMLGGGIVYEVKLDDEFLMSSRFTAGEIALAEHALAALDGDTLDVLVGGLGLGHTAAAALADRRVGSLIVVELLEPVIEWHRRSLVPLGETLAGDRRCRLLRGDFFALARGEDGFDPERPQRRFDAILLDIDHSPRHLLDDSSAPFYSHEGLHALARFVRPGGVFAMWSNDRPDEEFGALLRQVFAAVDARRVEFPNPYTGGTASCTVYVAHRAR